MYFKKMIGKKCYLSPIDVSDAEIFTKWCIFQSERSSSPVTEIHESGKLDPLLRDEIHPGVWWLL